MNNTLFYFLSLLLLLLISERSYGTDSTTNSGNGNSYNTNCPRFIEIDSDSTSGLGHRLSEYVIALYYSYYLNATLLYNHNHFKAIAHGQGAEGYEPFAIETGITVGELTRQELQLKFHVDVNKMKKYWLFHETDSVRYLTDCDYILIFNWSLCWDLSLPSRAASSQKHKKIGCFNGGDPMLLDMFDKFKPLLQYKSYLKRNNRESEFIRNNLLHRINEYYPPGTLSNYLERDVMRKMYDVASDSITGGKDGISRDGNNVDIINSATSDSVSNSTNSVVVIGLHIRVGDIKLHATKDYYLRLERSLLRMFPQLFDDIIQTINYTDNSSIRNTPTNQKYRFIFYNSKTDLGLTSVPLPSYNFLKNITMFQNAWYYNTNIMATLASMLAVDIFIASGSSFAVIPYLYSSEQIHIPSYPKSEGWDSPYGYVCKEQCCVLDSGDILCPDTLAEQYFSLQLTEAMKKKGII